MVYIFLPSTASTATTKQFGGTKIIPAGWYVASEHSVPLRVLYSATIVFSFNDNKYSAVKGALNSEAEIAHAVLSAKKF